MIHEIQHAIQSIEGFEEGYTTKLNKLDYFKRLGKNEEKNNSDSNIQESENNSGSFSFDKNAKRYEDLESANIVKFNKKTDGTINIEISNNNELINQFTVTSKENASKQLGNNIANYIYDNATETSKNINLKQTETAKVQDTSHKGKQLEIIKSTNPIEAVNKNPLNNYKKGE